VPCSRPPLGVPCFCSSPGRARHAAGTLASCPQLA
jgi:hypothetical protein